MKIIALGHRQQTGKDTLAGFLSTALRLGNRKINVSVAGFADELKDTCYRLYAWAGMQRREHYERYPEQREVVMPKLNKTPRQIWIDVGNHMRAYDLNVWVRALLFRPAVDILIIKDLRFPNELEMLREFNGTCIKVMRPDQPEINDAADSVLAKYTGWDMIVNNDGTRDDLNKKALEIIRLLKL